MSWRNSPTGLVAFLGSARLQRAGFGILRETNFPRKQIHNQIESKKSSRMQDAFASTLQACAPQNSRTARNF